MAEVTTNGLVQIDAVLHRQSSQDELDPATRAPLNEDRILLRRGRLGATERSGPLGAHLELDLNSVSGLAVRPFEAYVFARQEFPAELSLQATAGLMQIPFGFDARELEVTRPVLERADATRAFFGQARDFGAGIDAAFHWARVSVAIMNGQPLSDDRYAGLSLTREKDIVGRAGFATPLRRDAWVDAGVSWLFGTGLHQGTAGTKDSLQWVDGNEDGQVESTELIPVAGVPATASQTFARAALGADLRVGIRIPALGFLVLRGELVRAKNLDRTMNPADPVASGRDLRELGAQLGLAQELGPHAELAVRYDVYQPDADATRQRAAIIVPRDTRYRTWSMALAGKWRPGRLLLEYDHRRNALGISPSGAPTTLKDDALTLRAEVLW
jgi:hypothetical protein